MSRTRQTFMEFPIEERRISFDLRNPNILIIEIKENENLIKIELSQEQTDLLRLMLYDGHKARQQKRNEPGKTTRTIYERMKSDIKPILERLQESDDSNSDDWELIDFEIDIPDYSCDDIFFR